ncbi:MAG TPA: mechanosensitive ion channel family protein, partial [Burkholderiales bacterium]
MEFQDMADTAIAVLTRVGLQAIGAIIVWIVGRWLIGFAVRMISQALTRQNVDPTLLRYIGNIVSVALNIVLVVAILGYFGVETTSFAALVAGMGVAIGAAWGGLLANFAAGAFVVVLRPFKVGDFISGGGVIGTVMEIGLFASVINTPDNVRVTVGNNKLFSDNIHNFTANPFRRV